ncbi:MAG: hypothetical protein AAGA48_05185 [Myxococcota bacterium]
MPTAPPAVRVFHPEDRHITAAFLGSCGQAAAEEAFASARQVAGPIDRATFGSVKALGNPKRPSSFSALLDDGNEPLSQVIATWRNRWLNLAGKSSDPRPPLPHCTLARATRRATDAQRERAVAWGLALPTLGAELQLRPLALYTWTSDRRERLFRIWS